MPNGWVSRAASRCCRRRWGGRWFAVWWMVFVVAAMFGALAAVAAGLWVSQAGSPVVQGRDGVRPGWRARADAGGRHRPGRAAHSPVPSSVAGLRAREGADALRMYPVSRPVPSRPGDAADTPDVG